MVFVGIMAQLESAAPFELPRSVDECSCTVANATSYVPLLTTDDEGFSLFRISYLWYPFVGCLLTVFFSLIVSYLDSTIKYRNVVKINNRSTIATILAPPTSEPKSGIDNIAYNEKY